MKCVAYARVSTDEQKIENCSIPTQLNKIRSYAQEKGYTFLESFTDEGVSGSNPNRKGIQDMIEFCKQNKVNVVLVLDTDRLAREEQVHFAVKAILKKGGTTVESVNQPMINDTPEGKFLDSILAAVNALYPKITGRKTSISMQEKINSGWWPGPARIGYLNAVDETAPNGLGKNVIVLDNERAPLISKAFRLFATGKYTLDQLCDEMYDEGLRSKTGNKIAKQGMAVILREIFYTGKMSYKEQIYPGKHEPITDEETFRTCGEILDQHNKYADRKRKHNFLLSSYVICGKCGRHYTAEYHLPDNIAYYHCPASTRIHSNKHQNIKAEVLEEIIERLFEDVTLPSSLVRKIISHAKKYLSENHSHIDIAKRSLQAQKEKLETRRNNFELNLADGIIDSETYLRHVTPIKEELKLIEAKLAKLNSNREDNVAIFEELMAMSENVHEAYRQASSIRKRAYIDLFWDKIIVEDRQIQKAVPTKLFAVLLSSRPQAEIHSESQAHFIKSQPWLPEQDSNLQHPRYIDPLFS